MIEVAVVGSLLEGDDGGEHNGHVPPHGTSDLTGEIVKGSSIAYINGKEIAILGSETIEYCKVCCNADVKGVVTNVSSRIKINGKPVAKVGDSFPAHHGTLTIMTGEPTLKEG